MWEAGTPFALELERPGFNRLTGFSMNGMNGSNEAKNDRFWEVKVLKDDDVKYSVNGIFKKKMVLETRAATLDVKVIDALSGQPISGADIYYNREDNLNAPQSPLAKTDLKGKVLRQLTSGKYFFTVNYRGFRPLRRNLLVRAGETYALVFKIYPSN